MSFKIQDSDRHVMEPLTLWQKYLDAKIHQEFPISFINDNPENRLRRIERLGEAANVSLPPTYVVGDIPILSNWTEEIQIASSSKGKGNQSQRADAMHGDTQLKSMDESKVSVAFIFPTFAGYIVNHHQLAAAVSLAYAEAYNRWLKDYCDTNSERLKAVGLISRHDPTTMCNQLDQVINNGWTSITLRPEVIMGKDLGHVDYAEFWSKCEDQNIAVAFHGGTNLNAPTAGSDRFDTRFAQHACSHPIEAQMAFVSLLESGVLEQHPKLKIAFLEAGASWVPHWLWRLDNICYPEFPSLVQDNIKMLPSEYFKRQCWVAIEIGEPCLREVIDMIGHKKLLYGSDFPHPDHSHFTTEDIFDQLSDLTESEIRDIFESNAQDFYCSSKEAHKENIGSKDIYPEELVCESK